MTDTPLTVAVTNSIADDASQKTGIGIIAALSIVSAAIQLLSTCFSEMKSTRSPADHIAEAYDPETDTYSNDAKHSVRRCVVRGIQKSFHNGIGKSLGKYTDEEFDGLVRATLDGLRNNADKLPGICNECATINPIQETP